MKNTYQKSDARILHVSKPEVRHANTDDYDPKKGKPAVFRIHVREKINEIRDDLEKLPFISDDIYVWHGNNRHLRLRAKLAMAVMVTTILSLSFATLYRSELIVAAVTNTDGRILDQVMSVNEDLAAAALNEINVGH